MNKKLKKYNEINYNELYKSSISSIIILLILLLFIVLLKISILSSLIFLLCAILLYILFMPLIINILKLKNENNKIISNKFILSDIEIPKNIPLPYIIISNTKKILGYNDNFKQIFINKNICLSESNITDIFKDYKSYIDKQTVNFEDKYFEVYTEKCRVLKNNSDDIHNKENISEDIYSLTFIEITENKKLLNIIENIKTVSGLIYIDNYEEVIESIDEVRIPILTALIDRRLTDFITKSGGIIKKFEKDRYIFILCKKSLEEMKEKKFEILNEIKELKSGEHIPVTLSIGIGLTNNNLDEAMKNSKNAIELALGRGGDQVVIKDCETYLFYGGKSSEISHNARIRARVKADALKELMYDASNIFVMGHKNGDLDSMGSSIGIFAIAKSIGKDCNIILDNISIGVKRLCNRIIEDNLYDTMFIKTSEAIEKISNKTLIIITDTHRNTMVESIDTLKKAKKIVVFDHHRKSTDFIENAVLIYHEPYASSTSELVTEIIRYMGVKLKKIQADALLAGITVDTKNFSVKTGAITFEAAAFLKRNGADSTRVRLLFQNDLEEYKAKATTVKEAEIYKNNIAISVCPSNVENSSLTAAQSADDLLNITGIKASVVLCNQNNIIHFSARSFGDINVQLIMEKLGGGGHLGIAGAQIKDISIENAKVLLKQKIDEYFEEEI